MGVYARFADLLDYPSIDLPARLREAVACSTRADVREALQSFRAELQRLGLARLQEAYIAAFDLDGDCALEVGHHLFGEDRRRSLFMAHLAADYHASGFAGAGTELADHLPVLLRYIDGEIPAQARQELIDDAIVPAVRDTTRALARRTHPYAPVLRALLEILESTHREGQA